MSRTYSDFGRRKYLEAPAVTQLDLMDYLQLSRAQKRIEVRPCSVRILGSKCSICRREFKCITDIQKHMKKKHKYLKRKSDDKLVRIKLRLGKETFCDNKIYKKYLQTPERKRPETLFREDSSKTRVSKTLFEYSSQTKLDTQTQLSIPLEAALKDSHSFDQREKNINGERNSDSRVPDISIHMSSVATETAWDDITWRDNPEDTTWNSENTKWNEKSSASILADDSDASDVSDASTCRENSKSPNGGMTSPLPSDSETVVYVSDVEMDLSQLYEDVKEEVQEVIDLSDTDVEDCETVVAADKSGNEKLDTSLDDLEDECSKDVEIGSEVLEVGSRSLRGSGGVQTSFGGLITGSRGLITGSGSYITGPGSFITGSGDLGTCHEHLKKSEDTYAITIADDSIELNGLEEGDQDVLIIDDEQPQLVDFLEAAIVEIMEKCTSSMCKKYINKENKTNNVKKSLNRHSESVFNHPLKNSTILNDLKKMPMFNHQVKKTLEKLGYLNGI